MILYPVVRIQETGLMFKQTFLPFPYDFDAREGDFPPYRNIWYRNHGIRGRAGVEAGCVANN